MSWTPTRWHLHAASIAAAVGVFATVFWASRSGQPGSTELRPVATPSQPAPGEARHEQALTARADTAAAPESAQARAVDPEESTIAQYAAEKYQFLFDDLHYLDAGQRELLRKALLARERLVGETGSEARNEALAKVEGEIRGMLSPADHVTYQMLKDSDLELYKLNEYAGGVTNVAPLSAADRRAILKTKLAYKERFHQLLRDSNLQRSDLSAAEREYAYSMTSRALEDYQRDYLQEVRQYLANDEQYALLSNYETTEFKAELDRLRSMVKEPSQGGS